MIINNNIRHLLDCIVRGSYRIKYGKVHVDGYVNFNKIDVGMLYDGIIPIQFGTVYGSFIADNTNIKSLQGCPHEVGGNFSVSFNHLTSLVGGPIEVGGNYWCDCNLLTSLRGSAMVIGEHLDCQNNQLTDLSGGPNILGGKIFCYNNLFVKPPTLDGINIIPWHPTIGEDGRDYQRIQLEESRGFFV